MKCPQILVDLFAFMSVDGTGLAQCSAELGLGTYTLTFRAEDSDGNVAEAFAAYQVVTILDFDGDGDGYSPNGGDCNDSNQEIYPGAPEICDGLDNDCSELTPAEVNSECYDDDGDGYCEVPPCINTTSVEPDCNDNAPLAYPNAPEVANNIDDNCDGRVDEGTVVYDDDGDGYCETPPCVNTTRQQPDCNDEEFTVNPAATEVCGDGLDNDCDGDTNQQNAQNCSNFYLDSDGDGYGVSGSTQCWCEPTYPYTGVNDDDCYDNNADAYPGASSYHQVHRGDNPYDYNCDNNQERQYLNTYAGCTNWVALGSCEANSYGWNGAVPSCGVPGQYIGDCDAQVDYVYLAACGGVGYLTGNWSVILGCLQSGGGTCNPDYNTNITAQPCVDRFVFWKNVVFLRFLSHCDQQSSGRLNRISKTIDLLCNDKVLLGKELGEATDGDVLHWDSCSHHVDQFDSKSDVESVSWRASLLWREMLVLNSAG